MKNINYSHLAQNVIRCIVVYPAFFAAFVLSLPLNLVIWIMIAFEMLGSVALFIVCGKFYLGTMLDVILWNGNDRLNSASDIASGVFLFSALLVENLIEFNSSLLPVKS